MKMFLDSFNLPAVYSFSLARDVFSVADAYSGHKSKSDVLVVVFVVWVLVLGWLGCFT